MRSSDREGPSRPKREINRKIGRRRNVRKRLSKALLGIAGVALFGLPWLQGQQTQPAPGQAAQSEKKWKDQAEYDLFASITKETDPNKKLTLLNSWKEKYSTTDFK